MQYIAIVEREQTAREVYTYEGERALREDFETVPLESHDTLELWSFDEVGDVAELVDPNSSLMLVLRGGKGTWPSW